MAVTCIENLWLYNPSRDISTPREILVQTTQSLCQWLIHYITLTLDTVHLIYTMLRWLHLLLFSNYSTIYLRRHILNTFLYPTLSITYDTSVCAVFRMYACLHTSYITEKATHFPNEGHHKPKPNQNISATQPRIYLKLKFKNLLTETSPDYSLDTLKRLQTTLSHTETTLQSLCDSDHTKNDGYDHQD